MRKAARRIQNKNEVAQRPRRKSVTKRLLLVGFPLVFIAGAVVGQKNFRASALAKDTTADSRRPAEPKQVVQIPRGSNGEFAVQARINGTPAAMGIDTGATSVVLTYENAKAAGLPLEMLDYSIDVQTASGHTKAARLWLDRLVIGKLVERSVPALVVPHGQMKTNLLAMSFLDRLESWEVHADRLMLHGYP